MSRNAYLITTVLLLLSIGIILIGSGCDLGIKYRFYVGQRVLHVLDGREGIILNKNLYNGGIKYRVRFVCNQQTTDTGIISSDGPIKNAPYAEILCYEHELKAKR